MVGKKFRSDDEGGNDFDPSDLNDDDDSGTVNFE